MMRSRAFRPTILGAFGFLAVAVAALATPPWLVSLATVAFANALVVLGLVILWRTGLVPVSYTHLTLPTILRV